MKPCPLILATAIVALLGCGGGRPAVNSAETAPPVATSNTDTVSSDVASVGPTTATTSSSLPTPASIPAPAELQGPTAPDETASELTDGQILQIAHTANLAEVEQAKVAQSRTRDPRVKKLAAMMVRDHTAADAKGMAIAKKASWNLAPSSIATSLESDAQSATRTLRSESGGTFDRDYVDTQVKEHRAVLDLIDGKLLPDAKDADVKAFLAEVRPKVAQHLQHAQDLQSAMR